MQRFRQWPPAGQLVFALVVILAGVVIIGAITRHDRHPATAPIASRGPTPTTTPSPSAPPGLVPLTVAAQSRAHAYDRDADFGAFRDVDGCRNTRAEVLIRTSAVPVTFTRSGCSVATGKWTDPWSGVSIHRRARLPDRSHGSTRERMALGRVVMVAGAACRLRK